MGARPVLSLCMIARDEAELIWECLASVLGVAHEIIVGIDDRTTDSTADIVASFGARVHWFKWEDDFAKARNVGLGMARGDWILVLDGDDRLTQDGRDQIRAKIEGYVPDPVDGFQFLCAERDLQGNQLAPEEWTTPRLFRATPDMRYLGRVHEIPSYVPNPRWTWNERLPGGPHFIHVGYDPKIVEKRGKMERDTRLLMMRIEQNPEDAIAWYYLARNADQAGEAESAVNCALKALAYGPLNPPELAILEKIVEDYAEHAA